MTNLLLAAITPILTDVIAPLKTALTVGQTDPAAALQTLQGLAINTVVNVPTLENDAISEGCTLALGLLGEIEAKIAGLTASAPAPIPAPSPLQALMPP